MSFNSSSMIRLSRTSIVFKTIATERSIVATLSCLKKRKYLEKQDTNALNKISVMHTNSSILRALNTSVRIAHLARLANRSIELHEMRSLRAIIVDIHLNLNDRHTSNHHWAISKKTISHIRQWTVSSLKDDSIMYLQLIFSLLKSNIVSHLQLKHSRSENVWLIRWRWNESAWLCLDSECHYKSFRFIFIRSQSCSFC